MDDKMTLAFLREGGRDEGENQKNSTGEAKGLRILLAEDEAMIQKLMMMVLKKQGCHVRMATDGRQAVEYYRSEDFDLVLLDMHMPEMSGLEATQEIRRLEREAGKQPVKIIALTGDVQCETQKRCMAAGMDSFLSKPLNLEALCAILRQ